MALTYEKVVRVISKPPDMRKDFEVNNLLSWFRKKSNLFRDLKAELLFDIIKNLQLVNKQRDDLIITQGEVGDCMYSLLRGQVTIFIQYAAKTAAADEEGEKKPLIGQPKPGESVRSTLGTTVTSLGAGATFGEVALLSDDCVRTASIIVDESSDLIVVDRNLYNRSVKSVLKKEFEDKQNFIKTSPYFHNWPPRYKKQLAMALEIETFPYDSTMTKQGEAVRGIYFILCGEVKLSVDPNMHRTQFPKLAVPPEEPKKPESDEDEEDEDREPADIDDLLRKMSRDKSQDSISVSSRHRRMARRTPHEVCLLGQNETVGDIEVLLELDTYLHTATCTQRTEVLTLEMKHFERLLSKRNPKTVDRMRAGLEIKLKTRTSKFIEKNVPLLKCLCEKAEQFNEAMSRDFSKPQNGHKTREGKRSTKTLAATFETFLPPRGPLIDLHGPGTVFYRIRQREKARLKREAQKRKKELDKSLPPHLSRQNMDAPPRLNVVMAPPTMQGAGGRFGGGGEKIPGENDHILTDLENRMRQWLNYDQKRGGATSPGALRKSQSQTMLHSREDVLNASAPETRQAARYYDDPDDEDDHVVHTGSSFYIITPMRRPRLFSK